MVVRNWLSASMLCIAPALWAQQGHVAGPVAGYIFDATTHSVRPVLGIPGASVIGAAVNLGISVTAAAVSPRLNSVLASATDGSVHLFQLNSGEAVEVPLNGIASWPERIVFSPAGTSAAIYGAAKVQVLTGLPAAPAPGGTFDISALLTMPQGRGHHPLTGAIAVSDDGQLIVVSEGSAIQVFSANGSRQIITARNAAVAFAPGGHDIAAAGVGVVLVKDAGGAAVTQTLAGDDASNPAVGAAFSADGAKLYVAGSGTASVRAFDLAANTSTTVQCGCTPAGLSGMGALYRLNDGGSEPLWLLDPAAAAPRIVFVPAKSSL